MESRVSRMYHEQYLIHNKKITRYAKKQEDMTRNQEQKSMKTDPKMAPMILDLWDKIFRAAIMNILRERMKNTKVLKIMSSRWG